MGNNGERLEAWCKQTALQSACEWCGKQGGGGQGLAKEKVNGARLQFLAFRLYFPELKNEAINYPQDSFQLLHTLLGMGDFFLWVIYLLKVRHTHN